MSCSKVSQTIILHFGILFTSDQKADERTKLAYTHLYHRVLVYSENAGFNLCIYLSHSHTLFPKGILDVYRYTLSQVEFYGPTNFSTFLDKAIEYATGGVSQEAQSYYILLVITVRRGRGIGRRRGRGEKEEGEGEEIEGRATCSCTCKSRFSANKGFGHHQKILSIAFNFWSAVEMVM